MVPLASSGLDIAFGVIAAAVLFLWWLLRSETRADAKDAVLAEHDTGSSPEQDRLNEP